MKCSINGPFWEKKWSKIRDTLFSMIEILIILASVKFLLYEVIKWFVDYKFNEFMTKIIRLEHFTDENLENTLFYL